MTQDRLTERELDALAAAAGVHPDFCKIARVVAALDERAQGGGTAPELVAGFVDSSSLQYAADNRVDDMTREMPSTALRAVLSSLEVNAILCALWADGFSAGVKFQQAGGHEDVPEPTNN